MKTIVKFFSHALFAFGFVVFITISSNEYSWMKSMDPSMTILPVDEDSSSKAILILLLLTAIVATQTGLFFIAKSTKDKVIPIVIILVAISAYLSRYW